MPTSRNVTTHRILPFLLTISLSLLFLSFRAVNPGVASGVSPGEGSFRLSPPLSLPIPWQDDVFTPGLPASRPIGKRTFRKLVPVRVASFGKPAVMHRGFRPGPCGGVSSSVDSLAESLVLGRPPPAIFPPHGNAGT